MATASQHPSAKDIDFDAPRAGTARRDPIAARYTVDNGSGCWVWDSVPDNHGYGRIRIDGRTWKAHRLFYEHYVGPVPDGMVLDHTCRTRNCVNPAHLETVSVRANTVRGESPIAQLARLEECKRGHAFTEENTIRQVGKWGPRRRCRACTEARERRRREEEALYALIGHGR